jgi:hypothetical protein
LIYPRPRAKLCQGSSRTDARTAPTVNPGGGRFGNHTVRAPLRQKRSRMKLSDDRRTTWPPLLATSKPFRDETPAERGERYTIKDAYIVGGVGLHKLDERREWYVHLGCEGPDGGPAVACLGPYRAKLARSVVAALRKLRGQRLAKAGEVEIEVP